MIRKVIAGLAAGAVAVAAVVALPATATAQPGDATVYADGFEDGTLDAGWTTSTAANGTVALAPGLGTSGGTAVRMTVPDYLAGSIGYVRRTLPAPTYGLSASGSFKVLSGGCDDSAGYSAGSVPLLRFFDAKHRRVVGLVRINGSCSKMAKLYVQHSGNYYRTGKNIGFGDWNRLELRAVVSTPSESLVQVFMNGRLAYESTIADNGLEPFNSVTMHNEHPNQVGDLLADDVTLANVANDGPVPNPCDPTATAPANDFPGRTVLADGFEDYEFRRWTTVDRQGDATASIRTGWAHTPHCGARLHVTANTGSRASLSLTHEAGTREVYLDGKFRVSTEGVSGSNVPFFRVFSGATRVLDVYRSNGSGQLYVRTTDATGTVVFTSLGRLLAMNTWQRVRVHVVNAGAASPVRVWVGDALVLNKTMSLLNGDVSTSMVGSEHFAQQMDLDVDDVVIKQP